MVLSKGRKAELRAQNALKEGKCFYPRGEVNKAAFEDMKAALAKKTQEINKHTSSEADRIIERTTEAVLTAINQNTQPLPDQVDLMQNLMQRSAATLKKMCQEAGLETKNNKIEKSETSICAWCSEML